MLGENLNLKVNFQDRRLHDQIESMQVSVSFRNQLRSIMRCMHLFNNIKTSFISRGPFRDSQYYVCLQEPLTAGRPGREEVRDSPGLWRLSWERTGESIFEEPENNKGVECSYNS